MSDVKFIAVHPVLPVRDVAAAIEYYVERLGFVLMFQDSENEPRYAVIGRGDVELHLQWHAAEDFGSVEKLMLRFYIRGVDDLFEEYRGKSVFQHHTALRDTPWGTREFAFFDPDSNGLTFYRSLGDGN